MKLQTNNYWLKLIDSYIVADDENDFWIDESAAEENQVEFIEIFFNGGGVIRLATPKAYARKAEIHESGFTLRVTLLEDGATLSWREHFEHVKMVSTKNYDSGELTFEDFDEWGVTKYFARLDDIRLVSAQSWTISSRGPSN